MAVGAADLEAGIMIVTGNVDRFRAAGRRGRVRANGSSVRLSWARKALRGNPRSAYVGAPRYQCVGTAVCGIGHDDGVRE